MAHKHTVFAQLLKMVPRHDFESLARKHHTGRKLRKLTRWSQFIALGMGQLSGRRSLRLFTSKLYGKQQRDIVSNLGAQAHRLYHLGCHRVTRSSLARVNNQQSYQLYEALFGKLLTSCRSLVPKHPFRFKGFRSASHEAVTVRTPGLPGGIYGPDVLIPKKSVMRPMVPPTSPQRSS